MQSDEFQASFFRLCALLANPISHCGPLIHNMRCFQLQLKLPGDLAFRLVRLAM